MANLSFSFLLWIDFLIFMLSPLFVSFLLRKETPYSLIINAIGILAMLVWGVLNLNPMMPGQNPIMAGLEFWLKSSVFTVPLGIAIFLFEKFVHDWVLKPRRSLGKNQEVGPDQIGTGERG